LWAIWESQEPEPKPAADVAPSRLARAFGDLPAVPMKGRPSDASSSHATVSDAGRPTEADGC